MPSDYSKTEEFFKDDLADLKSGEASATPTSNYRLNRL